MKYAASTYSYNRMILNGKLTQLGCIQESKNLGFDAVDIANLIPANNESLEEWAKKLRDESDRLNIPLSCFTFGADFINGCEGNYEAEVARVKKWVDYAEILGVKTLRHDATSGYVKGERGNKGFVQALPTLIKGCLEITEYAQKKGIRTTVENHGFFCQDSERVEMLVNGVAHENFGLLVDMGNFLCADEDPAVAVGRVAPYAFYVHAKDFYVKSGMAPNPGSGFFRSRNGNYLKGTIIGHGDVPVLQCLWAIKNTGYDDFITLEFEGMEDNVEALRIGLENLKYYATLL